MRACYFFLALQLTAVSLDTNKLLYLFASIIIRGIHTVQLTSKLTLVCTEHTCFLNFVRVTQSEHMCDTNWAAQKSTFLYCTRAVFYALHVSNPLCAAHKLMAILYQRRIKAYNKLAC